MVAREFLPQEALYMIRYHSFYPGHSTGTYDALFNSIDATLPIVEGLASVTGVNTNSFNGVPEIWDMRAELYWDALIKGGLDLE